MGALTLVLLIITGLFIGGLVIRHLTALRFCVLCASVSATWAGLLVFYLSGGFDDKLLLGILMGQSITGLYYFSAKRLPKKLKIFTLPYFLSLTAGVYMLLEKELVMAAFWVLLGVWLAAWLVFAYMSDSGKTGVTETVLECCD